MVLDANQQLLLGCVRVNVRCVVLVQVGMRILCSNLHNLLADKAGKHVLIHVFQHGAKHGQPLFEPKVSRAPPVDKANRFSQT